MARALYAAGFRAGDLVHNSFSYHLTPARLDDGNRRACARLHRLPRRRRANRAAAAGAWPSCAPTAYAGTPSFLRILLEKADETGRRRCRACARRWSAARPSRRSLRDWLAARGVARLPELRHRRPRPDRLRDRGARRPGARRRRDRRDRAPGHRRPGARRRGRRSRRHHAQPRLPADPLRHRRPVARCCRARARPAAPTPRIKGWLGRADQTTKVRGMFVHPGQVAEHRCGASPRCARRGWSSSGEMANDRMTLQVEVRRQRPRGWPSAVADSDARRDQAARRGRSCVQPGSLPNDGKVIEDARSYRVSAARLRRSGQLPIRSSRACSATLAAAPSISRLFTSKESHHEKAVHGPGAAGRCWPPPARCAALSRTSRSPSSCRSPPAARPTRWRATWPKRCASRWAARPSSSRTSAAPAARSAPTRSPRPRRTATRCCCTTSAWPPRRRCTATCRTRRSNDFEYLGMVNEVPMTLIGKPGAAGEQLRRAGEVDRGQQGQDQPRQRRPGLGLAPVRPAVPAEHQGRHDDRAVQGHRPGDDRPARRPGRPDVRPDHQHHARRSRAARSRPIAVTTTKRADHAGAGQAADAGRIRA